MKTAYYDKREFKQAVKYQNKQREKSTGDKKGVKILFKPFGIKLK